MELSVDRTRNDRGLLDGSAAMTASIHPSVVPASVRTGQVEVSPTRAIWLLRMPTCEVPPTDHVRVPEPPSALSRVRPLMLSTSAVLNESEPTTV